MYFPCKVNKPTTPSRPNQAIGKIYFDATRTTAYRPRAALTCVVNLNLSRTGRQAGCGKRGWAQQRVLSDLLWVYGARLRRDVRDSLSGARVKAEITAFPAHFFVSLDI